ncbi:dihydrofolate reductase [Acholeplasma vituli]|uniref:dihydrofolate reductase n=1 Tax=Paracholeplasma vituli TaxID=69473 RepID=A0ABT2PV38_9MOLU|nr:dihydrofolate reductase [Paracholeplasma vituli]MCU0104816.1 dihydrofolate reductase [Paracholeplasma vituli]
MIKLIWAMDQDWLIGKDNVLPWHYKKDLAYFKEKTKGQPVLMGDMTYDSLKSYYKDKPLPFGQLYVASITDRVFHDAIKVTDIDQFLSTYKDDLFVIGGKTIYRLSLPYADQLYITFIDKSHEGNVYFPKFDLNAYHLIQEEKVDVLRFCVYEKVKS